MGSHFHTGAPGFFYFPSRFLQLTLALRCKGMKTRIQFVNRLVPVPKGALKFPNVKAGMFKMRLYRANMSLHVMCLASRIFRATLLGFQKLAQTSDVLFVLVLLHSPGTLGVARSLMVLDDDLSILHETTAAPLRRGHTLLDALLHRRALILIVRISGSPSTASTKALERLAQRVLIQFRFTRCTTLLNVEISVHLKTSQSKNDRIFQNTRTEDVAETLPLIMK